MSDWHCDDACGLYWCRRVLTNPMGIEVSAEADDDHDGWKWTVYATTPDNVEPIAHGYSITVESAKDAADRAANIELVRLSERVGQALGMLLVPPSYIEARGAAIAAERDAALALLRPVQDAARCDRVYISPAEEHCSCATCHMKKMALATVGR